MDKLELRKIIGQNVRNFRHANDIDMQELADLLDLSSGFLGLMERGERGTTPLTLYRLSEIFSVPIDRFFSHNEKIEYAESKKIKKKLDCLMSNFTEAELTLVTYLIYGIIDMKVGKMQKDQFNMSSTKSNQTL